eukprot:SAG31_NODE_2733_length_5173_cov_2.072724_3_plen_93_part_00
MRSGVPARLSGLDMPDLIPDYDRKFSRITVYSRVRLTRLIMPDRARSGTTGTRTCTAYPPGVPAVDLGRPILAGLRHRSPASALWLSMDYRT